MASSDDQADQMRAEVEAEDPTSFEQAMEALAERANALAERADALADDGGEDDDGSFLWAIVQYEEGTSGPLKEAAGILVDDEVGVTILDPETGFATSFGDRFVVRVDVQAISAGEAEGDDEDTKDQVDTSADRFRA